MEIQTETKLQEIFHLMEEGKCREAQQLISPLLDLNLECKEVIYTNSCNIFWLDSDRRLNAIEDPYEKGESFFQEWKSFQTYAAREKIIYEPVLEAVQHGFFSNALKELLTYIDEKDPFQKAEIYKKIGICYKKTGDFENARTFLSEANNIYPGIASVVAELADCYSLCGEDKFGKVLFREAFFLKPESIDIDFLDSQLIRCLIERTREKKVSDRTLKYWIPIYGVLYGVFNIKRLLTAQEVIKLKKNIYAMENEYKNPSCDEDVLVPLLLNNYFWLIDHYIQTNESVVKVNELLLKIKLLDSSIYESFIK